MLSQRYIMRNTKKIVDLYIIFLHCYIVNWIYLYHSDLLGNYLFCYNDKFKDIKFIESVNYARGLKYVLRGFNQYQKEILYITL